MEERSSYINSTMFDNLAGNGRNRSFSNSESSTGTLESPNPLYNMSSSRPVSKHLYNTITELNIPRQETSRKSPRRRGHHDHCLSRLISFLVLVIAATALIMVVLIMLGKVGPSCSCTTAGDPDQRTLVQRDVIRIIQNEVRDMKENLRLYEERADNLTREIEKIRIKTCYYGNGSHEVCPPGPAGPQGKQGNQGPPGPQGPPGYNGTSSKSQRQQSALNSSLCQYKFKSSPLYTAGQSSKTDVILRSDEHMGFQVTGVTCSTRYAAEYFLTIAVDSSTNVTVYKCQCMGSSKLSNPSDRYSVVCFLHYWMCHMAI